MTLEEARQKQAKIQRETIIKFSIYMILIIATFAVILVLTDFFAKYSILYGVFLILLYIACKSSKIYYLFRPKEFVGVIKYSNVTVENVKKYASHQPGATYDTTEVRMMYFVVSDEKRTVRKTIEYDWHWGDFYEGQTVAVLRFIDRPFLIIEPEKQNNVNS